MNHSTRGFVAAAVGVALAGAAPPARAAVNLIGEMGVQIHCSDAEGTPHPRRLEVVQPILGDNAASFDSWPVFAGYVGIPVIDDVTYEPAAGAKRMTIAVHHVKADGSQRKLARFRPRILDDGTASAGKRVATRLEPGDLLHWQLAFKASRPLLESECFVVVLGYGQVEDQLPEVASLALRARAD